MIPEITVTELHSLLQSGAKLTLLDVRQPHELEVSRLEGILHIPMPIVATRLGEIGKEEDIVVICRSGNRSAQITQYLLSQGYGKVRNLVGGMNEWAETVDQTMQIY